MGETVHKGVRRVLASDHVWPVQMIASAARVRNHREPAAGLSRARALRRVAILRALLGALVLAVLAPASWGLEPQAAPEAATGWYGQGVVTAKHHMLVTANPYATEAGLEILRQGGSAADAAVAVQLVLNLVEPQSSGLGGGAFVLYWDAARQRLEALDGRETAPAAADPGQFLDAGRPRPFDEAVFGGLSVGVPGTLRVLERMHREHGRLPWANVVSPAIRLASDGFRVSSRLHLLLRWYGAANFAPAARHYFFDATDSARPAGYLLKNPQFATTLKAIAEAGAQAFYAGAVAEAIVAAVKGAPNHQGNMTLADLAGYRALEREPLCVTYRAYRVCGMPPPSSGGLAIAQILKLIEPFEVGKTPADAMNAGALHRIAEAEKLAFADRDHYIADPAFVSPPLGLLDAAYLEGRRGLIDALTAMPRPRPGMPPKTELACPRRGRNRRGGRHQPFYHRRCGGQRRRHDQHHRSRVRLALVGGRISCSTMSSRISLSGPSTAPANPSPMRLLRENVRAAQWRRPSSSTQPASRGPRSVRPAGRALSFTSSRPWSV